MLNGKLFKHVETDW